MTEAGVWSSTNGRDALSAEIDQQEDAGVSVLQMGDVVALKTLDRLLEGEGEV
jgi:hypothetical protein